MLMLGFPLDLAKWQWQSLLPSPEPVFPFNLNDGPSYTKDSINRNVGPWLPFQASPRGFSTPPTADVTVAVSGSLVTVSVGTLSGSTDVGIAGSSASYSAGTVTPSASVALSGSLATGSTGATTANVDVALVGSSGAFSQGTLSVQIDLPQSVGRPVSTVGPALPFQSRLLGFSQDPNVSVNLSGSSGTFQSGVLTPDTQVSIAGIAASFSTGTLTTTSDVTVALTGIAVTFSIGAVTTANSVALQGSQSSFSAGFLSPPSTVNTSVGKITQTSGPSLPFAPSLRGMRLLPSSDVSVGISGILASFSTGVLSGNREQVGKTANSIGPALPFQPIKRGYTAPAGDRTVTLSGIQASFFTGNVGSSGPSIGQSVQQGFGPFLDFQPAIRSFTTPLGLPVALTGSQPTFSIGTATPNITVALTGSQGTFTPGFLSIGGNLTLQLSGQQINSATGILSPSTSVALSGTLASVSTDTLVANKNAPLSGLSAAYSSGTLGPATNIQLTPTVVSGSTGSIRIPSPVTVALTGTAITAYTGTMIGRGNFRGRGRTHTRFRSNQVVGRFLDATTLAKLSTNKNLGRFR